MRPHLEVRHEPPEDWAACLERCDGNFYHSPHWADANASPLTRALYFRWLNGSGDCTGVALGIERRSPVAGIGALFRRLDFESYPALVSLDRDDVQRAIGDLLAFADGRGYRAFAVQSFATRVPGVELQSLGLSVTTRHEFVVDLAQPEEEARRRLSSHHRRKIKRASAHGLIFSESCSQEALRASRIVQVQSRDRRVARGEWIPSGDDAAYLQMGTRLFAANVGRVFLASHGGDVVSAALVWIYRNQAFYLFGGSSDTGFALDAPAWLFWQAFDRCRSLGCTRFNLGGVPASAVLADSQSHGLYRFKEGFGGEQVACVSGHIDGLSSKLKATVGGMKEMWHTVSQGAGS